MSKNWLIKIQNPRTKYVISVYPDGTIYGNEFGRRIGVLTDDATAEIRSLIHEDLGVLKLYGGYNCQNLDGFIVKFWDNSNKKRNLKIKGWRYGEDVIRIIFKEPNFKRLFMSNDEVISILEAFYGEEYSDE